MPVLGTGKRLEIQAKKSKEIKKIKRDSGLLLGCKNKALKFGAAEEVGLEGLRSWREGQTEGQF